MLSTMRKSAGSWIIKILLFIIVIAFVLMGAGTFYAQRNRKVESVNGKPITVEQYQQEYSRLLANIRRQFQGNISDKLIEKMNLKQQALERLTKQALLEQSADRLGLRVPRKELVAAITQIPAFRHNGVFNQRQYQYVLRQNHFTPKAFESLQKDAMISGRVKTFVENSVQVSDLELRQYYNGENAAMNIGVVAFDPAQFTDVKATDADIEAYFKTHGKDYMTEPAVKARYARFTSESYVSDVNVTDDEVKLYYADHQDEFKIKVEKHEDASVKPFDKVADTIRKKLALEKAKNIAYEKAGAAYDVSYDGDDLVKNSKPMGFTVRETGLFTEAKGPSGISDARAFAKTAFGLEQMEISDVVEVGGAYYLIQVIKKVASKISDLKDVKDRVTADVLAKKRNDAAKQAAKDFLKAAKAQKNMTVLAKKEGLKIETTGFFKKNDSIPAIGRSPAITDAAFKLGKSRRFPDAVINSHGKFYVIWYKGGKLPDAKAYEAAREKTEKSFLSRKQTRIVEQWIAGLKQRAEIKTYDRYMPK